MRERKEPTTKNRIISPSIAALIAIVCWTVPSLYYGSPTAMTVIGAICGAIVAGGIAAIIQTIAIRSRQSRTQ